MKRPKDRLNKVVVIGATPAGVAATDKLGELGIPVVLVDSDVDLDWKFSSQEIMLKSKIPLNYAFRSKLIRILRNPGIKCLMPGEVTQIKHSSQGFRISIKQHPTYIDSKRCVLCGRCSEICPVLVSEKKAINFVSRRSLPAAPFIDKKRQPLCQEGCPLNVNVQGYLALAKAKKFTEALSLIRQENILPGICGRICTHPCEASCRRGELDSPIAIKDIKRFLVDCEIANHKKLQKKSTACNCEKIAIVGSGPAGLAAANELVQYGYQVTVFEKEKSAGGLLRYGIGAHRLPRNILDYELNYLENLGVKLVCSCNVDFTQDTDRLKKEFKAVIFATGAWRDRRIGVPGENIKEVEGCLSFLTRFNRGKINYINEKVAVIGDGNSAFDLARTLVRLGSKVFLISWFSENMLPADPEEIDSAIEEGVSIVYSTQVVAFIEQNSKLAVIRCMPTELGESDIHGVKWPKIVDGSKPFDLTFDGAFVAIGQTGPFKEAKNNCRFKTSEFGYILADESFRTTCNRVYAAGDAVSGPSSVVDAMAHGKMAAQKVHNDISRQQIENLKPLRPLDKDFNDILSDVPSMARSVMPEVQPAGRKNNFKEVALGLSESQAVSEAERCLQCGICSMCMQCVSVCEQIGAIKHDAQSVESVENAGVVIIADAKIAPNIRGEDIIRAYFPKAAKPDVYAIILSGFAAASRAMVLLNKSSQWPRGHGVLSTSPDPGLSSDIRIGIFACTCNESFGWIDGMGEHVEKLSLAKDVVHAEVVTAACIPEEISSMIRTIREKGITRVVLASCVCCPLNFICSSCTDQRSRLKDALFKGTGISRAMVETCNLRGEVLCLIKKDVNLAFKRFKGLLNRSVKRAKKLKPLPAPVRDYNFSTAVVGESEAAISSALALAEVGLDVVMFGMSDKPLSDKLIHTNIQYFKVSLVKGFSGTLGNFQIFIESEHSKQTLQVGAVIMGEKSRKNIQYIHQDGVSSRIISYSMQKYGIPEIPYLDPGTTSISGLYLADPPGINISKRKKGAAAAVMAAAIMPRGPRQSKGFTVVVEKDICRGCARCIRVCPSHAITLYSNKVGGWFASVDEVLCKGCGTCISVCPSNAADSPYRDQKYLEQAIEEILED